MATLDQDFGKLWRQHFSQRKGELSRKICLLIENIVRARSIRDEYIIYPDKMGEVLRRFGIPPAEFYQFVKEETERGAE